MLNDEVLEAVEKGRFHVWSISTVDEGLALLTGKEPGKLQKDGTYPEDTLNHAAIKRLGEFADIVSAAKGSSEDETNDEAEGESEKKVAKKRMR
jgi:hypothetical protein